MMIKFLLFFLFPLVANAATNVAISTTNAEKFNYVCDSFQIDATGTYQFAFCRTPTPPPPPASGDIGFMKGTWRISANHYIVDQSEPKGAGDITKVPGCANQKGQSISLGYCPASIGGFAFNAVGKILSVRYISKAPKWTEEHFQLNSEVGSGIPFSVTMSLSQNPGEFPVGNCTVQGRKISSPRLYVHSVNPGTIDKVCKVEQNKLYYLNIRQDELCSLNCTFKIVEPWSFM